MNLLVTILFFLVVGILITILIPVVVTLFVLFILCLILHGLFTRFNDIPRNPGKGRPRNE